MGQCTFNDRKETSSEEPCLLLEDELARRWRICLRTLQRRRKAGDIPGHLRIGNRILYPRKEVEQYEARRLERVEAEERRVHSHVVDRSGTGE